MKVYNNTSQSVLRFYNTLPFNIQKDAKTQSSDIKNISISREYPPLAEHLSNDVEFLEIGCGVGWLSNAINFHYKCKVTGVDFSSTAIERAKQISKILDTDVTFLTKNLFQYSPNNLFDVVTSLGVLHHTEDCMGGVQHISKFVKPGGFIFIGLYHSYGRKPFLDHFTQLKAKGFNEDVLLEEFVRLFGQTDSMHLKSWFSDQVMHPHETQHTLAELNETLVDQNFQLLSTSINRFEKIEDIEILLNDEHKLFDIGRSKLLNNEYYPGFFVSLYQKQ